MQYLYRISIACNGSEALDTGTEKIYNKDRKEIKTEGD